MPAPDGRRLRLLLGAFGDPGHAFPLIALGAALAARGHAVTLQTWRRWEPDVRAAGMEFAAAPEYHVFPTRERPLKPYEAVVRATGETRPLVAALRPDAVVADILTLAPALAAELEGVPAATVIPHVDPRSQPGWPPYSLGARLPRTPVGRRLWGAAARVTNTGLEHGRRELNETRRRLGLGPLDRVHGGISSQLALVATFPQLEYPRTLAEPATHVVGPLLWEPPFGEVELPAGDDPLVLVAPSTSQDPSHRLLRAALAGLAGAPVRVLASTNRRPLETAIEVPANTRLVDWVSYSRTMPRWRHERERRPHRLGRRRSPRPPPPLQPLRDPPRRRTRTRLTGAPRARPRARAVVVRARRRSASRRPHRGACCPEYELVFVSWTGVG